jgi:MFS transporter, ACS family, glucarate transporter
MPTSAREPPPSGSPTRVRYLVVGLATLASLLLYLDRYCLAIAEPYIKEDLGLSRREMAWVYSAFFWTYALAQVPSGFLSDRYGARRMLTLYILAWSVFTGLIGLAGGFVLLLLLRFGFGLAQAGAYPTSAVVIGHWVPQAARGSASGLIAVGGRAGAFLAQFLTALLIVALVPPEVSSRFGPADLLDCPRLCHDLVNGRSGLGPLIRAGLPPGIEAALQRHAARYETARKQGGALAGPTAAEREALVRRLNEALRDPALPAAAGLPASVLPEEARSLLARPPADLSPQQRERLNRLVLETAYPESLRKVYGAGWRPVMVIFGLVGLLVAGLSWFLTRDRPALHPWCNEAEVRLIEGGLPAGPPPAGGEVRRAPLGALVRNGRMWLMCASQFGTNIGWVVLVISVPTYLEKAHQVPLEERGFLAGIPVLVGWAGMLIGGWATDRLVRTVGVRWGRALPLGLSRFTAAGAYLACLLGPGPYAATVAFAVVALSTDFGTPATWGFALDVGGRHVGSVLGWGNMWGNLGAAVAPLLVNWVRGDDNWGAVFLMCAGVFLVSGLCALGINAAEPLEPSQPENDPARG